MKPMLLVLALSSSIAFAAPASPPAAGESEAARREIADLQKQVAELSKRMAELSLKTDDRSPRLSGLRYLASPDRAVVGIVMTPSADGVRIGGVSPDGPAEKAGLRKDDIITSVDGHAIAGADDVALRAARERLRDLKEGQKVKIGYRRASKGAIAEVTASRREALSGLRMLADLDTDAIDRDVQVIVRHAGEAGERARIAASQIDVDDIVAKAMAGGNRARIAMHRAIDAMPLLGVQMTALNPDLGRYFGTSSGVLVLSTEGDALDGIKGGDVIQKVAGTAVERPADVLRKLRGHPDGDKVALQLLRDRKPVTLSVNAPKLRSLFEVAPPPVPPAPPAPPTPPSGAVAPLPPPAPPAPALPPVAGIVDIDTAVAADTLPGNPSAPASIKVVAATPALQTRLVSPGAAAKGGQVGLPGLWAGRITAVEPSDGGTC